MKWIDRSTGEQPLLKKENALKTYPLGGVEKVIFKKICGWVAQNLVPLPHFSSPSWNEGELLVQNPLFPTTNKGWIKNIHSVKSKHLLCLACQNGKDWDCRQS